MNIHGSGFSHADIMILVQIQYQNDFHKRRRIMNSSKLKTKYLMEYMSACHEYRWFHSASFKNICGAELCFFLVRSPFLLAGTSFWPTCSGTATYSLVALLVAVLLNWINWVAKEAFRVWPKWHSILARRVELNSSNVTRLVATEQIFTFKVRPFILQLHAE